MPKKAKKKKRGPPRTTGPGTLIGLRCHPPFVSAVDEWRGRQEDDPSRPAAIVRLAELGLTVGAPIGRTAAREATKASELARDTINQLADEKASAADQASRKRQLIKGPEEFRDFREDHRKRKK
jgi:hypothetical protein